MNKPSKELIELCGSVTAKRPKTVIDHILKNGFITTEELKDQYVYNHPPRAARDVREHGIPLETFRVIGSDGRKIAAYRFGVLERLHIGKGSGRTGLSKKIKNELIKKYGSKCFIYIEEIDERELQIDHRVPFEIAGDYDKDNIRFDDFMLLCGSANRAKLWYCEHCENWNKSKDKSICAKCYWAYPEEYSHVGMKQLRRVDIIWQDKEIESYEKLKARAKDHGKEIPEFVKAIINKELVRKKLK